MTPTLVDVQAARSRIAGRVRRTPLVRSDWLSDIGGGDVFLKLESLQITNSFKARGALNALLAIVEHSSAAAAPTAIVTASAGNHGRALAWAAQQVGIPVVIYTPRRAPATKLDAIRRHGADLRAVAETYEESERLAKEHARVSGCPFISAYSHPDLLAAIGTIALEVVEDLPGVDQVIVPTGGGGLLAGLAAALDAVAPATEVVGVEVEASHPFAASLAAGRIVEVEVGPTIADGLAGNMDPDNLAFPIVQALVDRMAIVGERQLEDGIRGLVHHEHLIAEGAGIAGVAAILGGAVSASGRRTAVVVSGANIDSRRLRTILEGADFA
ncbi:MAG TPA: threonine/serine dehydratase [Vicinamibacterales bacterium]|jgi:threonine dehydratase